MSKYFTGSGDDGTSGLLGEGRVTKDNPRLEAIGAIDEANAALGLVRATSKNLTTQEIITTIQRDLYKLMAEISATPENAAKFRTINFERVRWLEEQIASIGDGIEMPKEFILPGDTIVGGILDLARTIIRRSERRVSSLFHKGELENGELLRYLNRLSSFCYVLELSESRSSNDSRISLAKNEDK
jgi:cob(I)alamin adenosyltransferase